MFSFYLGEVVIIVNQIQPVRVKIFIHIAIPENMGLSLYFEYPEDIGEGKDEVLQLLEEQPDILRVNLRSLKPCKPDAIDHQLAEMYDESLGLTAKFYP